MELIPCLTPKAIVEELNKFIIGQEEAKRAVAIALRNRFRRQQLPAELRDEVMPPNILMIGPTGVGKTEIARRLAKLANAPFLKIEATKYTEVGYVGRDVESMIRDLAEIAVKEAREKAAEKMLEKAEHAAIERILNCLLRPPRDAFGNEEVEENNSTRLTFKKKLLAGELDDTEIDIEVQAGSIGVEIMAPPGMEEMTSQLQNLFQHMGKERKKTRKLKIKDALKLVKDEEAHKMINEEELRTDAIYNMEQNGIIFIDEIDKVTRRSDVVGGGDVSREGVQRDLLPVIEGCRVTTKYGTVDTSHILFIASGAFQVAKPSDLIPELQGRLPIRVELKALTAEDFERILTERNASLTEQYTALLGTEGLSLNFTDKGIKRIAAIAYQVNERTENIGARRLSTIMERLLEEVSFDANDRQGETIKIDAAFVDKQLMIFVKDEDLARYIL